MAATLSLLTDRKLNGQYKPDSNGSVITQSFNSGTTQIPSVLESLSFGTGAGKANKIHCKQRTVAGSSNDDIDLAGGLTDVEGNALTFTKIKLIAIQIIDPDWTKYLIVGPGAASNTFNGPFGGTNPTLAVYSYQDFIKNDANGWTVTAGTGDILRITNGTGTSTTYLLLVAGEG